VDLLFRNITQFVSVQVQDVDERAVFLKFELFAKRLNKLIDMFTTIHQFSSLEQHTHISGTQKFDISAGYLCKTQHKEPWKQHALDIEK
jgi:hypothetical protein